MQTIRTRDQAAHVWRPRRTFRVIEHIRTQDEVQLGEQKHIWRQVPPGQAQDDHVLDTIGPAAPSAVLQTGRSLSTVRQEDLCPAPGGYHTWKTHTCAQLRRAGSQMGRSQMGLKSNR